MIYEPYTVTYTAYRKIVEDSDIADFEELLAKFSHLICPKTLKTLSVYNYTITPCVPTIQLSLNPDAMLQRSLFIKTKLPGELTLKDAGFYSN